MIRDITPDICKLAPVTPGRFQHRGLISNLHNPHCVAFDTQVGAKQIVRYTTCGIHGNPQYDVAPEHTARIHQTHLDALRSFGINVQDTHILGLGKNHRNIPGVFYSCDLLPEGSQILMQANTTVDECRLIVNALGQKYLPWAIQEPADSGGVIMADIAIPRQYSRVPDGTIRLHDTEPLYCTIGSNCYNRVLKEINSFLTSF